MPAPAYIPTGRSPLRSPGRELQEQVNSHSMKSRRLESTSEASNVRLMKATCKQRGAVSICAKAESISRQQNPSKRNEKRHQFTPTHILLALALTMQQGLYFHTTAAHGKLMCNIRHEHKKMHNRVLSKALKVENTAWTEPFVSTSSFRALVIEHHLTV